MNKSDNDIILEKYFSFQTRDPDVYYSWDEFPEKEEILNKLVEEINHIIFNELHENDMDVDENNIQRLRRDLIQKLQQ
jgi:hypothetical protein